MELRDPALRTLASAAPNVTPLATRNVTRFAEPGSLSMAPNSGWSCTELACA